MIEIAVANSGQKIGRIGEICEKMQVGESLHKQM